MKRVRLVRHGKEHEEETYEPVEWPPQRRDEPTVPEPEPTRREEPDREKTPA